MNTNKVHGAVIYTRVSTGEQAEHGTSLESQRDICRQKALALSLPIIAEYEDAGISGGLLVSRVGMQAALAAMRDGRADTLICANLSRFSRDAEHQQTLKREIEAAGGRVVFCDMTFDDTPEGDLAFGIMGNFTAYEKAIIRKRTMAGKRRRAEEGQQPQRSRPAYGYHVITNAEVAAGLFSAEMRGRYALDERTAPVAGRIWTEYAQSGSLTALARALNAEGIPTPGNGQKWLPSTLHYILTNPVYKGEPVSGRQQCGTDESRLGRLHKFTGVPLVSPEVRRAAAPDHRLTLSAPAIVTEAEWDAVQELLKRGKGERGGLPHQTRMLSGMTFCPHCGARAGSKQQRANGKKYLYLACRRFLAARHSGTEAVCVGDVYRVETVEQAALLALRRAWQAPEAIAAALAAYPPRDASQEAAGNVPEGLTDVEPQAIDAALEALKSEEASVVQAQIAGIRSGASPDAYAGLFADIAARRKDLAVARREVTAARQKLMQDAKRQESSAGQAAGNDTAPPDTEAARRALEEAWEVLTSPDVEGSVKRALLMSIVERVVCQKAGADVVFRPGVLGIDIIGMESIGMEMPCVTLGEEASSTFQTTCIGIKTHR